MALLAVVAVGFASLAVTYNSVSLSPVAQAAEANP
jgi:hypothetical protein